MAALNTGRKIVLAILFFLAGVTVASRVRQSSDGDYGRLLGRQLPVAPAPVVTRTVPVVTEAPAPPAAPDPMLAAPVATQSAAQPAAPSPVDATAAPVTVSDSNGSIVVEHPHLLSGGIFKQQN